MDLEKIRESCDNDRDRALIEFACATGMRVSEIVNTNIDDLDMINNKLKTIGKGNKEREILFSDKTKFYLERYLSSRTDNNSAMELVSIYNYTRKIEGLSDITLKNRFYILRELDNFIQKSYDEITTLDLRMYILHKQKTLNATSINNLIGQIKPFFQWLQDEGYITSNPFYLYHYENHIIE